MDTDPVTLDALGSFFKEINKPEIRKILERFHCSPEEAEASNGLFHEFHGLPSSLESVGLWETIFQLVGQQLENHRNVFFFDRQTDNLISSFLEAPVKINKALSPTEEKRNAVEWLVAYNHVQHNWEQHQSTCRTCSTFPKFLLQLPPTVVTDEVKGDPSTKEHKACVPFNANEQIQWDAFFAANNIEVALSRLTLDDSPSLAFPLNPADGQSTSWTLSSVWNGRTNVANGTPTETCRKDTHATTSWFSSDTTPMLQPSKPLAPGHGKYAQLYPADNVCEFQSSQSLFGTRAGAAAGEPSEELDNTKDEAAPGLMDRIMRRADDLTSDDGDSSEEAELPHNLNEADFDDEEPVPHHDKTELYKVSAINHEQDYHEERRPHRPFVPKEELFRKKVCAYFYYNGKCSKGDSCNFSHVILPDSEIPKRVEDVGRSRPSPTGYVIREDLRGTKICKYMAQFGVCKKGDTCTYSHDLSRFAMPPAESRRRAPPQHVNSDAQQRQPTPRYQPPPHRTYAPRDSQRQQQQQPRLSQEQRQGTRQPRQQRQPRQLNNPSERRNTRRYPPKDDGSKK